MIVQIVGNVKFPITLDPGVWIFDDRKIPLDEAFTMKTKKKKKESAQKTAEMFDQEIHFQTKIKPPVRESIKRFDRNKMLSESYVMPLKTFIENVEINKDATSARLIRKDDDDIVITIDQLMNSYALFSKKGKPLNDSGPLHLYFGDGSNKTSPFTKVKQIVIE